MLQKPRRAATVLTLTATLIAALTLAGSGAQVLIDDPDRPPIVVLGGSVTFSSTAGWSPVGASGQWRADAPKAGAPAGFRASVSGATPCQVAKSAAPMEVIFVRARDKADVTFRFVTVKDEVQLNPGAPVTLSADRLTLTYAEAGTVKEVRNAGNPACSVPAKGQVDIRVQKMGP